ncbi:MAG TPA: 50S ribosomal protein L25 [Candidatus Saccharimonadales bacterium]|nr:50S ribosomal protein L25 [Candidatus Saccharimonadales bacterium]
MSQDIILSAQKRDILGKQVKKLRNDGLTPGVIHERGQVSLHVSVPALAFKKAFSAAGKHHAIKIDVGGKKYTTIIKEVVNAPASNLVQHAVFQAIKEDEKVTAEIPLRLVGEIPAERAGLLVLKNAEHLIVEALPKDLIDVIEVDGALLEDVGNKIHVSDIKLPDTITIKTDQEYVIATVEMPKDQIAEADAALEEQKAAEGAVEEGEEPAETEGEAADVPAEKGTDSTEGGQSEGEIRPGGKKEFEDKSQGHNPEKK